jgi:hypothetical protein
VAVGVVRPDARPERPAAAMPERTVPARTVVVLRAQSSGGLSLTGCPAAAAIPILKKNPNQLSELPAALLGGLMQLRPELRIVG